MTTNRVIELESLEDTFDFADEFAKELLNDSAQIIFLLFQGGLGAGKTTFTRELGKALGIDQKITSPTFIGLNEYHTDDVAFFHLDLYQVQTEYESIKDLTVDDMKNIFVIEWSEKMPENLLDTLKQNDAFKIMNLDLEVEENEKRTLTIC